MSDLVGTPEDRFSHDAAHLDPTESHFNIVKLGLQGMNHFSLFVCLAQNMHCEYSLEPTHRGGFNEYPQPML